MAKKINLQRLTLTNFKGIKQKEINFNSETTILGKNGSGKTSLFDAFTWVLFGKDSTGATNFGIKTNDSNGNSIQKLDHIVEAELSVDGETIVIRRTLKENWVKKRGSLESEFSGHKTEYLWNEVPKSQKEFQDAVNELLDETLFKLITNPLAFNSLKWTEQRAILIEIAGEISQEELTKDNKEFESLAKLSNKELEDEKKKVAFKKKRLNDDIKSIPTRIDEVYRNMPEEEDYATLERESNGIKLSIETIEEELADKSKAYESELDKKNKLSQQVFEQKQKQNSIEFEIKKEIDNEFPEGNDAIEKLEQEYSQKEAALQSNKNGLDSLEKKEKSLIAKSESLEAQMDSKRKLWEEENAKELKFDEGSFVCPSCSRDLEAENIEQEKAKMLKDFKTDQSNTLIRIQKEGIALSQEKESIDKEITDTRARITKGKELITNEEIALVELNKKLEAAKKEKAEPVNKSEILQQRLALNVDYINATQEIERLEVLIAKEVKIDNEELKAKLKAQKENLATIEKQLTSKSQREAAQKRVKELSDEESKLAQQISEIEKQQFDIENFEKSKANLIENKVNNRFKLATFKLFETQINGGEVPTCKTLTNGVEFSDQNNALKINTGVDIINTLSEHYGVVAPIFIDNRESVTDLIESDSQIINLVVSPEHKELTVK